MESLIISKAQAHTFAVAIYAMTKEYIGSESENVQKDSVDMFDEAMKNEEGRKSA